MTAGLGQFHADPGSINLALGHPAPELLAVDLVADAARAAVRRHGPGALDYGAPAGPPPAIEAIRRRLSVVDARAPLDGELLVTAGTSAAIDQVATLLTRPGDVVLVESPTYHLALQILADHPVELVAVPADAEGLDVDALVRTTRRLRAAGRTVRLVYSVPTFSNPTGASLAPERRRALVRALAAEDLLLVEDDAYRELAYDDDPPPSVWSEAQPGSVVRLGTFSKSLAPGLRVGFMTASPALIGRFVDSGLLNSGGGTAHLSALVVAETMASGAYAANVTRLCDAYRSRRDALVAELARSLPEAEWSIPGGGYFLWLRVPDCPTDAMLEAADAAGIRYVPGRRFSLDGADASGSLRLAFSRYPEDELREGVRRLARVLPGWTERVVTPPGAR